MTWIVRILQAIASLAGIDVAGAAVAGELRQQIASLKATLILADDTAAKREKACLALLAEKDRQIEELTREIDKRTRPGDVAGWWDDRVRDGAVTKKP